MGILKGRNSSNQWVNASVVYGWNSSGVKTYAKALFMRKADNTWERGWTDCRKHDEDGRDWTAAAGVTEYQGSCGNRESRVRTDYSKTGCTSYSRYTSWVSASDCNSTCFTSSTATVYRYSCADRESTTRTTYTANTGSGCTTYSVDGTWVSDPTCAGSCTVAETTGSINYNGQLIEYVGPAGYYGTSFGYSCKSCPSGCAAFGQYYVTVCNGTRSFTQLSCGNCQDIFSNPC